MEKIDKFDDILETEFEKLIDKIISAGTINPSDEKIVCDTIELMLKSEEFKDRKNERMAYSNGHTYSEFPMNSNRRGRSSVTGRYVSMASDPTWDEPGYSRRSYGHTMPHYSRGYSGHSIKDRMIDSLERMYDEANTEHERQVLDEWMNKIEMEK